MNEKQALRQHQLQANLIDPEGGVLYCAIPKNACSTMKYNFITAIYEREGIDYDPLKVNRDVHQLLRKYCIKHLPEVDTSKLYAFAITRDPYERLVSVFLDKFVRSSKLAPFATNLLKSVGYTGANADLTFADFLSCLLRQPVQYMRSRRTLKTGTMTGMSIE